MFLKAEQIVSGQAGRAYANIDGRNQELLYLKFVQGIPIVGVVGGLSDMVYQKKISDYAALKYKRRFLLKYRRPL